jgi:heme-degrading monooxygenase HmoA
LLLQPRAQAPALGIGVVDRGGLRHDPNREGYSVILEHAILDVKSGQEHAFETAFDQARTIIASMRGYAGLELQRCLEAPNRYLLLVRWQSLEDHTLGFRGSPQYQEWKALLHHFYDPFPAVEHYEVVFAA